MALELIAGVKTIEALKPGAGRLTDGSGLYLLPFAKGDSHYWRFDYTYRGKRNTLSLGVYPEVGLAMARVAAADLRTLVAGGNDPAAKRSSERKQMAQLREAEGRNSRGEPPLGSFEEIARRWFSVRESGWMEGYSSKVIRRLEVHVFPYLGQRMITEIAPPDVLGVCRRVEAQGAIETAHRVLKICSQVFRFAVAESKVKSDPCRDLKGALKNPTQKNFAAITDPRKLGALLGSIDTYTGTFVVRCALKLAPMLMVRPSELRLAQWQEFDLDNGLWYVPSIRMKRLKTEKLSGDPHLVPLPRQAVEILEELFLLTGRTGLVFPAEGRTGRSMSDGTINAALRAMGYSTSEEMTGHGFRATARTILVERLHISEAVAEMQLAHAVKDANGTAYNRAEFHAKRIEMMQIWADYLENLRWGRNTVPNPVLPEFRSVMSRLPMDLKPEVAAAWCRT